MTYEWKFPRMDGKMLYQLHFRTGGAIVAWEQNNGFIPGKLPLLGMALVERSAYQIGDWMLETIRRPYGFEVLLRRGKSEKPLEIIVIRADEVKDGILDTTLIPMTRATVNIRLLRDPIEERTCQDVGKLTIGAESIRLDVAEQKKPAPRIKNFDQDRELAALMADPAVVQRLDSPEGRAAFTESERAVMEGRPHGGEASGIATQEELRERLKALIQNEKKTPNRGRRPSPKPAQDTTALELQEARNQAQAAMARLEAAERAASELEMQLQAEKRSAEQMQTQLQAEKQSAEQMQTQLQAEKRSAEQIRAQLETEQRRNADLQIAASGHLQEVLSGLTPWKEQLAGTLQEQLRRAEEAALSAKELEDQTEAARQRAEEAEARLAGIRTEMERLRSLETLRSLDCGQMEKELSVLREQFEADGYTAALLEEEPFFDGAALEELLEETRRQLEKLEDRFAEAVRQRERIDGMIQDAALRGNGLISLKKELG